MNPSDQCTIVRNYLLQLNALKVAGAWFHKGLAYLIELVSSPNNLIYSTRLRNLFNLPGKGSEELETAYSREEDKTDLDFSIGEPELPVKATDEQAIIEIKKHLQRLIIQEATAENWNDLARLEEIRDEKDKILEYLKQSLTSRGKIKTINSREQADYRAIYLALQRTIGFIQKDRPDIALIIERHLITGIYFQWKEDNVG